MVEHVIGNDATRVQFSFSAQSIYQRKSANNQYKSAVSRSELWQQKEKHTPR
jgi:hypothetical protein